MTHIAHTYFLASTRVRMTQLQKAPAAYLSSSFEEATRAAGEFAAAEWDDTVHDENGVVPIGTVLQLHTTDLVRLSRAGAIEFGLPSAGDRGIMLALQSESSAPVVRDWAEVLKSAKFLCGQDNGQRFPSQGNMEGVENLLQVRLWHGQRHEFEGFVPTVSGHEGPGIYFADRFEEAAEYGDVVIEAEITIKKPYYFYPSSESLEAVVNPELLIQVLGMEKAEMISRRMGTDEELYGYELQQELISRGYDGIVAVFPTDEAVPASIPGVDRSANVIVFGEQNVRVLRVVDRREVAEMSHSPSLR